MGARTALRRWPLRGWLGLALVAVFWTLNWTLEGPRTHWGFFPLWLGYALTVDSLVLLRRGGSMFSRSPGGYALLFVISIPAWWLFELLNRRTGNWSYEGRSLFTSLQYALYASLSFSTVMPAVFGTAELMGTFRWIGRFGDGPRIPPSRTVLTSMCVAGCAMLALLLIWPRYFFPFLWGSAYLIVEPLNIWMGNRSLLDDLSHGDWRPVAALSAGCLVCGFFWEMWNYLSFPRWTYTVPFVGFWKVFEMPLLGYLGYLPFSLELYAIYNLVTGIFDRDSRIPGPAFSPRTGSV
jgi:hypothetical protein